MSQVLVIHLEDNADDRALLEMAIEETGLSVRILPAENAVQTYNFMRLMKHRPPDLVVIDLNLPVIRGQSVLRDLKSDAHWCDVPAVVLSSSDLPSDVDECLGLGANAYYVKPQRYEGYLDIARKLRAHLEDGRHRGRAASGIVVAKPPIGAYRTAG